MPKVSIVVPDDCVVVDGDARKVDLSAFRARGIRAVQWDGAAGAVEPVAGPQRAISALPELPALLVAHQARKEADALALPGPKPAGRDLLAELADLVMRANALEAANLATLARIVALERRP
jgi:hypothetical protein